LNEDVPLDPNLNGVMARVNLVLPKFLQFIIKYISNFTQIWIKLSQFAQISLRLPKFTQMILISSK